MKRTLLDRCLGRYPKLMKQEEQEMSDFYDVILENGKWLSEMQAEQRQKMAQAEFVITLWRDYQMDWDTCWNILRELI